MTGADRVLQSLREQVWARAEGRCEARRHGARCNRSCNRRNWEAHVHHRVYRGHAHERLEDLELRCLECHGRLHPQHTFLTKQQQLERRRGVDMAIVMTAPQREHHRRRRVRPLAGLTQEEKRAFRGAGWWAWRPEAS